MQPLALIAEVKLGGPSRLGEACRVGEGTPNVIGIIWTYLHELMGEGCPMAHGDLRRLYLGVGGELGGRALDPTPPSWGPRWG